MRAATWCRAALVVAPATIALAASPSPARAVDKHECAAAYEDAQKLRASGSLRAARERLLVCSDSTCPAATQADCLTWIGEVDQQMPTLLLVVLDAQGQDAMDVEVTMDGKPYATRLDGKALPVDPGPHELVFSMKGSAAVRRSIVVREGEKGRRIEVSFAPAEPAPRTEPEPGPPIHPATWALGGVGLAGIGLFGIMAGLGLAETADAEESCAPRCTDDVVGSIETKFLVGDIGLGVGIASLAAAVVVGIVSATSGGAGGEPVTARVHLVGGPVPGGALVGVDVSY